MLAELSHPSSLWLRHHCHLLHTIDEIASHTGTDDDDYATARDGYSEYNDSLDGTIEDEDDDDEDDNKDEKHEKVGSHKQVGLFSWIFSAISRPKAAPMAYLGEKNRYSFSITGTVMIEKIDIMI